MPARHVVVDGSNMATEGSSLPSLKQLDEAVREYLIENPDDIVTVVVDATFGHRIPTEERKQFEEAESAGEIVSPPAGAIGRGDAFLLRVADKVGAVVLSNDSFQEFHGEYEWLFDKGRLIGAKPVPGVGWIFTPRTPVRGPKSRESVKEAKRKRHAEKVEEPAESGLDMAAERSRGHGGDRKLQRAIAAAVEEAVEPSKAGRKRRRRRRGGEVPSEPLNEPFKFITFIAAHQLGDEVEGSVDEFSSHGAFISVDGARCYLPLSAMGEVPPRSAREVLRKSERRTFVVQAFDAMRRGIELALPGFARPAGTPTAETIDAEIHRGESGQEPPGGEPPLEIAVEQGRATAARRLRRTAPAGASVSKQAAKPSPVPEPMATDGAQPRRPATKRGGPRTKAVTPTETAREARAPSKVAAAKKATAKRARLASEHGAGAMVTAPPAPAKAPAAKASSAGPKQSVAKQSAAKQSAAKQPPVKQPPVKQPPAKQSPAKQSPPKQSPPKQSAVTQPAKEQVARKQVAKKEAAEKVPSVKSPGKRATRNTATTTAPVSASRTKKSPGVTPSQPATSSTAPSTSNRGRAATTPGDQKTSAGASTAPAKKSRASSLAPAKKALPAKSSAVKEN
jgi:Zc3h12a-like Ribonuclease NYN domain/S1 RNA binding domain